RARRAGAAARAQGAGAMDAAVAEIGAAFDHASVVNAFKLRVEETLRRGPQHPAVRARFGARAERLAGLSLDGAVATIERWWRDERKAFQIASALGYGNRLSLDVLRELRLILQLMRRKRMAAEFGAIAAAVCDETMALAAE
ncbi:MAG: hypothetical protein WBF07_03185, partial [Xanthobacteraceae bacterium]